MFDCWQKNVFDKEKENDIDLCLERKSGIEKDTCRDPQTQRDLERDRQGQTNTARDTRDSDTLPLSLHGKEDKREKLLKQCKAY